MAKPTQRASSTSCSLEIFFTSSAVSTASGTLALASGAPAESLASPRAAQSALSSTLVAWFSHVTPAHLPHASVHPSPCRLHVHLLSLQLTPSAEHLQLNVNNSAFGARQARDGTGASTSLSASSLKPQRSGSRPSSPRQQCTWQCNRCTCCRKLASVGGSCFRSAARNALLLLALLTKVWHRTALSSAPSAAASLHVHRSILTAVASRSSLNCFSASSPTGTSA